MSDRHCEEFAQGGDELPILLGLARPFHRAVEELRAAGAKYVFLKTGAYRPADLARAIAWSSTYGIDLLTVDGAGGGTGMSPWSMMNEWGVPTFYLQCLANEFAEHYVAGEQIAGRGHLSRACAGGDREHPRPSSWASYRTQLCRAAVGAH